MVPPSVRHSNIAEHLLQKGLPQCLHFLPVHALHLSPQCSFLPSPELCLQGDWVRVRGGGAHRYERQRCSVIQHDPPTSTTMRQDHTAAVMSRYLSFFSKFPKGLLQVEAGRRCIFFISIGVVHVHHEPHRHLVCLHATATAIIDQSECFVNNIHCFKCSRDCTEEKWVPLSIPAFGPLTPRKTLSTVRSARPVRAQPIPGRPRARWPGRRSRSAATKDPSHRRGPARRRPLNRRSGIRVLPRSV